MTTEVLGPIANATEAWVPDDGTFGARLALIRQRMGWGNVKEAATACGVPPESWRTWERDNVSPRGYERICKTIAAHTGCDVGWLMGGSALRGRTGQTPYSARPTERPRAGRPPNRRNGSTGRPPAVAGNTDNRRPVRRHSGPTMAPRARAA